MRLAIPEINSTPEAVRFGQAMDRDQYIFLWGVRARLQQELSELRTYRVNGSATDRELELSFRIQFYREALENARPIVLASIIGICTERPEPINAKLSTAFMSPIGV